MVKCYLALGSNLRCPNRQLHHAVASLRKLKRTRFIKQSSIHTSKPIGVRSQPVYCNMILAIETLLAPLSLLGHCQAIENQQQRLRKKHWGARTLDIDIILYGNQILKKPRLTIPHPHMLTRDFVLLPLLEIAPFIRLPQGELIIHYLKNVILIY